MSANLIGQCIIEGFHFNPGVLKLASGIRIIQLVHKGEIVEKGRYKGEQSKSGYVIFDGELSQIIRTLKELKLTKRVVEDMNVSISILIEFSEDLNFEISSDALRLISKLNIPIGVSVYRKQT